MNIQAALKSQYHAGLGMLRQTIERCPGDLWVAGEHPRNFWRIGYHALFYTDFYLAPNEGSFQRWERHREESQFLTGLPWPPHNDPQVVEPYTQRDLIGYLDLIAAKVDVAVDQLDLSSPESGFPWYQIPKLDHQIVNIRHLQQHTGQLAERSYAEGIDLDWKA